MDSFRFQFKHFRGLIFARLQRMICQGLVDNLEHQFMLLLSTLSLCMYIAEQFYFIYLF